ncbi:MAG: hypothetical protein ACM3N4_12710 [Nitrososphaerota archaeon]
MDTQQQGPQRGPESRLASPASVTAPAGLSAGVFVVTPLLIVLLLFTNDFVIMSIATDRAAASPQPVRWRVKSMVLAAGTLAAALLVLSFTVFFVGRDALHLPLPELQTLIFLMLVFSGQGLIYLVRSDSHFWRSRPGRWLLIASAADIAVVSLLATHGLMMAAVSPALVGGLLATVLAYLVVLDIVKVRAFRALNLRSTGA